MIFQVKTGGFRFLSDPKEFLQQKFQRLGRLMHRHNAALDEDAVEVRVSFDRSKHHQNGEVVVGEATLFYPHHEPFHAVEKARNWKICTSGLVEKLRHQLERFKEKVA